MSYVVRLKPFDPRKGQVAQSYAHAGFNLRWNQGIAIRDLPEDRAAVLREMRQPGKGLAPLFDVVPEAEWEHFLAVEAAVKLGLPPPVKAPPAPEIASAPPGAALPIEGMEHVDLDGQRVQLTQAAPVEAAPEPVKARGPKKPGGTK